MPLDATRYLFKKNLTPDVFSLQLEKSSPPILLRKNSTDVKVFNDIFYRQEYDIDFYGEPDVIVDCGANIGLTSVYFAKRFPNATIISVEPEKGNFEMLQKNTAAYKNIHPVNYGLWNRSASLQVFDWGQGEWAYTVEEVPPSTPSSIPAISIPEIMERFQLKKIDVLKVDIEGSEKELFEKGTAEWLPFVNTIVIELHDRFKKGCTQTLIHALEANGEYKLEPFCESIVVRLTEPVLTPA